MFFNFLNLNKKHFNNIYVHTYVYIYNDQMLISQIVLNMRKHSISKNPISATFCRVLQRLLERIFE